MESYPINLETFSNFVGYDNEINLIEAGISNQINFETKKELISLISLFMKQITKQKEKEILDANKSIAIIITSLDSTLKKINLFTKSFITLSEEILSSDMCILNVLNMPKEEAIYAFTKYVYKSDRWFQRNEFINSREIYHYFNLKQKAECDIKTKVFSASNYENNIKSKYFALEKLDPLHMWEILNDDLKFLFNLYGENGKYSFVRKYEPELDQQYNDFLTKYNYIKEQYFSKVDIVQQKIAFNNSNRSNCIYNSYSWENYTNIMIYNVISESFIHKTIEVGGKCSDSNFCIKLSDFILFLCRENFYIVDTLKFSIKMIVSPINHKFESGLYHENCIYLFERNEKLWHHYMYKYDLVSNKLSKLSTLSEDLTAFSCVIYKNSILIAWHDKKFICKYDINIESYSRLPFKPDLWSRKYLLSNNEKLFLINEEDAIYESQDDEYHWLPVCQCPKLEMLEMSYIWKENMIYIGSVESNGIRYYIFDLKSKRLIYQTNNINY